MGRAASWVRGIKLKDTDEMLEVTIVSKRWKICTYCYSKWYVKNFWNFRIRNQNRGWSGVKAMAITPKTGKVIGAMMLDEDRDDTDLLLMSKWGQTIRLPLKWIRAWLQG